MDMSASLTLRALPDSQGAADESLSSQDPSASAAQIKGSAAPPDMLLLNQWQYKHEVTYLLNHLRAAEAQRADAQSQLSQEAVVAKAAQQQLQVWYRYGRLYLLFTGAWSTFFPVHACLTPDICNLCFDALQVRQQELKAQIATKAQPLSQLQERQARHNTEAQQLRKVGACVPFHPEAQQLATSESILPSWTILLSTPAP
jgi:hypothetical protein